MTSLFRTLLAGCASLAIIGAARAQEKTAPATLPQEAAVLALGAAELGRFAALALANGCATRARQVWLEVLGEYASDDAAARKALGWIRHGSVWQRDPQFDFPGHDRLDVGVARMLEQQWRTLATKLGAAHRSLATELAATAEPMALARAAHHGRRALRFTADDAQALAHAGLRQLEGIHGDDVDLTVLERSRRMERALGELVRREYTVDACDDKLALLDAIRLPYSAFRSEHFTVFGDHDADTLRAAAQWAERALAFCEHAFDGFEGFPARARHSRTFVFLKSRDSWARVLLAKSPPDVAWLLANVMSYEFDDVETAGTEHPEIVHDLAVRWVAHDYSGMTRDALQEGIGHAIVGMFFGRNLVFTVGQPPAERTVAGPREQGKLLLPDLETWIELGIELAWRDTATPAARLPLLQAAQFPTDARIKAWSFCDYLLRRDPTLLTQLQRAATTARGESDVHAAFERHTGTSLLLVEDRWRTLWTDDTPLRRAVLGRGTPLEAASREAPAWLTLWNDLRRQHGVPAVGWSAELSGPCKEHVDYLRVNKDQRGPAAEHTQLPDRPGHSNAGRTFAADAVVWTQDAKKAAATWLLLPGYRDAVLDDNVDTVGIYAEGGIVVVDATRGRMPADTVHRRIWPRAAANGKVAHPVPAGVDVELFGPDVRRLLAAATATVPKQIGCPLTLHGHHSELRNVVCAVTCKGEPVAGVVVRTAGATRRTTARGLWTFYPLQPWPRGVDVHAAWSWHDGAEEVTFVAR